MKKLFTFLFSISFLSIGWGQINAGSPFPIDFLIENPTSIAGNYDYGTQADDWGPMLNSDLRAEVIWAYDATDSLACTAVVNDLTGKMALIRRGVCNFSTKIWNAEQAGAVGVIIVNHFDDPDNNDETVINMALGANMEPVTIPAVFVSRSTGVIILSELDAGNTVTAAFDLRNLTNNSAPFAYQTPMSQVLPLTPSVGYFNDDSIAMVDVNITATITEPDGTVTVEDRAVSVGPLGDSTLTFTQFVPTQMGAHMVMFTTDVNADTLRSPFVMTENTFAVDTGDPSAAVSIGNDRFVTAGNEFHVGSAFYTGPNGGVATWASFAIGNPDTLFTNNPNADLFSLVVYDMDPDGDGVLGADYPDFEIVGFGGYTMTGNEQPHQLLTVEFFDPIVMKADGGYAIMVQYLGETAGIGKAPTFSIAGATNYPLPSTLVYEPPSFFTGGWASNNNHVVRLHLDGFTSTKNDLELLESSKVNIFPNPVSDNLNVELDLNENSENVRIVITDLSGKQMLSQRFENVKSQTFNFNVSTFSNGAYLMNIITDEGFRVNKFVVNK